MMTPLQRYQTLLAEQKISHDPAQAEVIEAFEALYHALTAKQKLFSRLKTTLFQRLHLSQSPITGLYLWGGVGRGKTFLMDLFFHSLPFRNKARFHFHRFMYYVHHALKRHQGKASPLAIIAKEFSRRTQILCFDEFYVSDIADAMILSELFRELFFQGVTLVATSNLAPEKLYYRGLQREKFLPTIDLIHTYCKIMSLVGKSDYRLAYLTQSEIYHYPLDEQADINLANYFEKLAPERWIADQILTITDRQLPTRACADSIVWFDFTELCEAARSALDYIEIARCFHTVLISGVRQMGPEKEDVARRFIALIDEFYERHVNLIVSAEVALPNLYQGERLSFEFQRTISRLTEMQSAEYLAKAHLP